MQKKIYAIEGLDRLGKSTLIQGILDTFGYYQVIHFAKPQRLKVYEKYQTQMASDDFALIAPNQRPSYVYQRESFTNSMKLATSGANIIFDRWHIGEVVYSPMYRTYSGEYVFDLELQAGLDKFNDLRLILLTENFDSSRHFVDDGNSLGTIDKREEEQSRFIDAFHRSNILDKKIVSVTNPLTGTFRNKEDILNEAIF